MLNVTLWNFVGESSLNEEVLVVKNRDHDFTHGYCALIQHFHHFPALSRSDECYEFQIQGLKKIIDYQFK